LDERPVWQVTTNVPLVGHDARKLCVINCEAADKLPGVSVGAGGVVVKAFAKVIVKSVPAVVLSPVVSVT
jgi:hypothetical protein